MRNLKPYLDAAQKADAEVSRILNEIDSKFNEGTDESRAAALAMRPALDAAKTDATKANEFYASMRDASIVNDGVGALFSEASDPAQEESQEKKKVITRAALAQLQPFEARAFFRGGGRVTD